MSSRIDVPVTWKGYLHTEDGRECLPTPQTGEFAQRITWCGPGDGPKPGERVFGCLYLHDSRRWPCERPHPVQPDPLPMVAVIPKPGGELVHLMLPGYKPAGSHKSHTRSPTHTMCGQIGSNTLHWNISTGRDENTGREHWPVSVAATELASKGYLRWCHACIGRAIQHLGLLDEVARMVVLADVTPPEHQ